MADDLNLETEVQSEAAADAVFRQATSLMPLDAFVRSVAVNARVGHMLLLGAGASISSQMPSAANCVWQWKRSIFLSNHPGLERSFEELSLGSVQGRIQAWLDQQPEFPAADAAGEYGFYIERCYPVLDDRRAFFQRQVQAARPGVGYRVAARLAEAGLIRSAWTTNFDGLLPRALAETSVTPLEVGLDTTARVLRPDRSGELSCVALHGDYRYDALRNTDVETQRLDESLRQALVERAREAPLIVLGYSGRDVSIMEALTESYRQPGPGTLYWCGYGDGPPPQPVAQLIDAARAAGRTAFYVPGAAFDDTMRRLALAALADAPREAALAIIAQSGVETSRPAPFAAPQGRIGGILKSTAFKLRCPVEAYAFAAALPDQGAWAWLRERLGGRRDLVAVPFKRQIWALGTLSAIDEVFGDVMSGKPQRVPLDAGEVRHEDGAITHLLVHAIAGSIAEARGLSSEGALLWDPASGQNRRLHEAAFRVCDAVLLYIRRTGRETVLVMKPTVKVFTAAGAPASEADEKAIKLSIFGYQHNDKFNAAVERWRRALLGPGFVFTCPAGEQTGFAFAVDRAPISAAIVAGPGEAALPAAAVEKTTQRGFKVLEPKLLFGAKTGPGTVADEHPIRGLVSNRPLDVSLTRSGLLADIKLGVLCPAPEARSAAQRLKLLEQPVAPADTERDYLMDFPGFQAAFGLPLAIPVPGDAAWRAPEEPPIGDSKASGARFAARAVIQAIDELRSASRVNVILIVTPARWTNWRSYETEAERFDLHDFVKAYCARKGIATQFIDEETLSDPQACRIRWWLSLAIYAKSFRTPFVLKAAEQDTAYVGFGTSVDRHGPDGRKVVLGCSHIFNAEGQGLQYRLSKVENPTFDSRRRNAFLSRDDARRVGESIRQLFFEARGALPRRVVIHKRT